jgi:hypothetical protein
MLNFAYFFMFKITCYRFKSHNLRNIVIKTNYPDGPLSMNESRAVPQAVNRRLSTVVARV